MCGAVAGVIGSMAGSIIQGIAGSKQANAEAASYRSQEAAANANAKQQIAMAEDASARGRQDASDYREDARQVTAAQRTAAGASGIDTNSGSANLLYNDAENRADSNVARILSNAGRERAEYDSRYAGYRNEANAYASSAAAAKKKGRWSLFSGLLGAGTTAAGFKWGSAKDKTNG